MRFPLFLSTVAAVLFITAAAESQPQYSNRQLLMLSGTGGEVLDAGFFASGRKIGRVVYVVAIEFLDLTTGRRERRVLWPRGEDHVHSRGVASAQLSADGRRIVTGSYDGTARVWSVHTGELLAEVNAVEKKSRPWGVIEVAFSADGERVVVGFGDGEVWLWRPDTGDPVVKLPGHSGRITSLSFSPDGMRVVTGSADGTARVWRAETGRLLSTLKLPVRLEFEGTSLGAVTSVAFNHDGMRVLTGSGDGKARLWYAYTGALIGERTVRENASLGLVAFSPDGRFGLAASGYGPAQLWHLDTGEPVEILEELRYPINTAAFSADGERMIVGGQNGSVFIMESGNAASRQAVGTTASRALHTRFVEHENRAAWVSFVPAVEFVDTYTGARKHVFLWKEPGQDPDVGVATHGHISPDGAFVVTRHGDGIARVWRAKTGEQIAELKGHTDALTSVAFSPDGRLIATGSIDDTARLWRPETGELVAELTGHELAVSSVAFSPDGKYVVTGSTDRTARVWHAPSGALVGELRTGPELLTGMDAVLELNRRVKRRLQSSSPRASTERRIGGGAQDVRFSANGELFAVYSGADTLMLWRAPRWRRPTSNTPSAILKSSLGSFALGPAGRRVTTWVINGELRIWDLDRCSETVCPDDAAMVLMTGTSRVQAFSPDGRLLLTGGDEEGPKLWSTSNGLLLTEFVGHQGTIGSASFDAGGRRVLTTGAGGTVRLWEISAE